METSAGRFKLDFVSPQDYGLQMPSACQKLSPLDMNMPRIYAMQWILCFPIQSGVDQAKIYSNLKLGLAHTVAAIPWLAGVVTSEQGSDPESERIQISDDSSGVELSFHDLTGILPSYTELKAENFPISKFPGRQISPLQVIPKPPVRVMAAQANFIEGGLLLTIGAHHAACDGFGLDEILRTWAWNTKFSADLSPVKVLDQPSNDRQPLMKGIPGADITNHPEYVLMPRLPQTKVDITSNQRGAIPMEMPPMSAKIFHFSPDALASLKSLAAAHSTNDALTAFVWRHMTLARYPADTNGAVINGTHKGQEERTTAALFAADIRNRTSPPLCPTYLGNASMAGITKRLLISDVTQESGFQMATAAIRSSVNLFNSPGRIPLTIGLIESQRNPTDLKFAYNGFFGPDISVTSWATFGIYKHDWGVLGNPEAFRVPGEGADGVVMVLPMLKDGALEVLIGLESKAMERLVGNSDFDSFAKLRA